MSDIDRKVTELGGGEKFTTNNKMELTGAIEGLSHVEVGSSNVIYTDSSYVINGIIKWIHGWKKNGWKTKTKEDVSNKDLWIKLLAQIEGKKIEWKHVSGHAGIVGNERCDRIATAFADGEKMKLYNGALANYDLPNILNISPGSAGSAGSVEKKSSSSHSKAKAYSYVSSVGGVIETHHTWAECEKRVKGAKGARYKKSTSIGDEAKIIEEFEEN
jgi:ribonuclease HI